MKAFLSKYLPRYTQVTPYYTFEKQIIAMFLKESCTNAREVACPCPPKWWPRSKLLP